MNSRLQQNKEWSNFSKPLLHIPGFLFDVPDLVAFPKPYKERITLFYHFQRYWRKQKLPEIRDIFACHSFFKIRPKVTTNFLLTKHMKNATLVRSGLLLENYRPWTRRQLISESSLSGNHNHPVRQGVSVNAYCGWQVYPGHVSFAPSFLRDPVSLTAPVG